MDRAWIYKTKYKRAALHQVENKLQTASWKKIKYKRANKAYINPQYSPNF